MLKRRLRLNLQAFLKDYHLKNGYNEQMSYAQINSKSAIQNQMLSFFACNDFTIELADGYHWIYMSLIMSLLLTEFNLYPNGILVIEKLPKVLTWYYIYTKESTIKRLAINPIRER